jgi:hypothetical protein
MDERVMNRHAGSSSVMRDASLFSDLRSLTEEGKKGSFQTPLPSSFLLLNEPQPAEQ